MTHRPSIPWFQPHMTGRESDYLREALDANFLNDGPLTRRFEQRVAALIGARHCVAVTSGTAAIALALMAKGVGYGDEVIVPDLTFVATANAVRLTGATPVLVDIEPARLCLDPGATEAAIGPRTRGIVTVDVNGRGADYGFFEEFCRKRDLALVCDSAEALGSRYAGRSLGLFGDAGCFSFSAAKTVTTGQGGMIVTNDTAMADRLRELKDQGRRLRGTGGDDLHPTLGFNFKFTDLQAAVGLAQLDAFEERLVALQRRDRWYVDALAGIGGLIVPDMDSEAGEVRQWADVLVEQRAMVRAALDADGIGYRAFWFPVHSQQPYHGTNRHFPVTDQVSAQGLWLPSHFGLTESDVGRTADCLRQALRQ